MKHCTSCGLSKPITAYAKQKLNSGNYSFRAVCKVCNSEKEKRRYKEESLETKNKRRNRFMKKTYGINLEEYNMMFFNQQGKCASCGRHQSEFKNSLVIDHDHKTGKVRGLLCTGCNLALGNIQESAEYLEKLKNYIASFKHSEETAQ